MTFMSTARTRGRRRHGEVYRATDTNFLDCARPPPHGRGGHAPRDMLEAGLPRPLFGPILAVGGRNYAVSADGKRFLTYTSLGLRANVPITLIQNWQPRQAAVSRLP